jgi:hypothetical protein
LTTAPSFPDLTCTGTAVVCTSGLTAVSWFASTDGETVSALAQ